MKKYILIAEEGERALIDKYLKLPQDEWEVVVTGVGAINVIRAAQTLPKDSTILNIGYAGSANFEIGSVVRVQDSRLNHPHCGYAEPFQPLDTLPPQYLKVAHIDSVCYSGSDFVLESDFHDCVFDMELAYIAAFGFAKTYAIKVVSDNLSLHTYHQVTNGVE